MISTVVPLKDEAESLPSLHVELVIYTRNLALLAREGAGGSISPRGSRSDDG